MRELRFHRLRIFRGAARLIRYGRGNAKVLKQVI